MAARGAPQQNVVNTFRLLGVVMVWIISLLLLFVEGISLGYKRISFFNEYFVSEIVLFSFFSIYQIMNDSSIRLPVLLEDNRVSGAFYGVPVTLFVSYAIGFVIGFDFLYGLLGRKKK